MLGFARTAFAVLMLVASATCGAMADDEDEPVRVQPAGIPAKPGQYAGFLDWAAQQSFSRVDAPDDVVNDYAQCWAKALYGIMSGTERDVIDIAARTTGMTADELDTFTRNVARRMARGEYDERILAVCQAQWDKYSPYKMEAEE